MLVFFKERLVLLAVPKTGTTALHSALRQRADIVVSDPPELKHLPLYHYNRTFRPMFENLGDVKMETIAVMREPISWLSSWYRFRQRSFLIGQPNATHDISFDDFVQAYMKGKRPGFANVGSQAKFLEPQRNGTSVTHLFRYENSGLLHQLLQTRLNTTLSLERENVSPEMDVVLSPKIEQKLRKKCAHEFALYESIAASEES